MDVKKILIDVVIEKINIEKVVKDILENILLVVDLVSRIIL